MGRNLKPRKIEKHYLKAIRDGIKEYQIEEQKLKQPKIEFNLSQLSTIRADAAGTRDSLLTEEELQAEQEENKQIEEAVVDDEQENYGLSSEETTTITLLLKGKDVFLFQFCKAQLPNPFFSQAPVIHFAKPT